MQLIFRRSTSRTASLVSLPRRLVAACLSRSPAVALCVSARDQPWQSRRCGVSLCLAAWLPPRLAMLCLAASSPCCFAGSPPRLTASPPFSSSGSTPLSTSLGDSRPLSHRLVVCPRCSYSPRCVAASLSPRLAVSPPRLPASLSRCLTASQALRRARRLLRRQHWTSSGVEKTFVRRCRSV